MFSLPVAFGFLNLAALGWLAAAAAPILIHLWMRQTRRETPWAAIRFLQQALERQARRLRLQHWILLAIRTLALLLIALAAAKPYLEGGGLGGGEAKHYLLVLDNSLSMQLPYDSDEQATRFDAAVASAEHLLDSSRSGDRFTLVALSGGMPRVVGDLAMTASPARSALEQIVSTDGKADLTGGLLLAQQLLSDEQEMARLPQQVELILYTDLGKNSCEVLSKEATSAATEVIDQLAEQARLSVIDVGQTPASNVAVASLGIEDRLPTSGRELSLRAELFATGSKQSTELTAELIADGMVVASRPVTVTPSERTTVRFPLTLAMPGLHRLGVKIEGDACAADNERLLAVDLKERLRVLCVEGRRGAAAYVADALNPTASDGSLLAAEIVSDADLVGIDLERFSAVFLCNVGQFDERESEQLRRYVAGGGGLVFFLGDQVRPVSYEGVITLPQPDGLTQVALGPRVEPILPIRLGEPVSESMYGLDPLSYAHPIVQPFRGQERSGLLTTPVNRYFVATLADALSEPSSDDEAHAKQRGRGRVALALPNGDPLIVTSHYGLGRTVVVTTAGSLRSVDRTTGVPWTAMPAWPSFLPLVRGMLDYAMTGERTALTLQASEPLTGPLEAGETVPEIQLPDGSNSKAARLTDLSWQFNDTHRAGFYRLSKLSGGDRHVAINPVLAESLEKRIDAGNLLQGIELVAEKERFEGDSLAGASRSALQRTLLLWAFALLLIETLLASLFGRASLFRSKAQSGGQR